MLFSLAFYSSIVWTYSASRTKVYVQLKCRSLSPLMQHGGPFDMGECVGYEGALSWPPALSVHDRLEASEHAESEYAQDARVSNGGPSRRIEMPS